MKKLLLLSMALCSFTSAFTSYYVYQGSEREKHISAHSLQKNSITVENKIVYVITADHAFYDDGEYDTVIVASRNSSGTKIYYVYHRANALKYSAAGLNNQLALGSYSSEEFGIRMYFSGTCKNGILLKAVFEPDDYVGQTFATQSSSKYTNTGSLTLNRKLSKLDASAPDPEATILALLRARGYLPGS